MATPQLKQPSKPVMVHQVFAYNLQEEFDLIENNLRQYPYLSIDTEFPGTVVQASKPYYQLSPSETYMYMRENVNRLNLIQIGLTLSDTNGNLPDCGSNHCCVWEFNFREFDLDEDPYDPNSIALLQKNGIDFIKNQIEGIDANDFAQLFMASGLGFSFRAFFGQSKEFDPCKLTWIFFHSTHDIGYLIKLLTGRDLPANHVTFMALVQIYLGTSVFDLKEMVKPLGWQVGLEKVAENLKVKRIAGQSHQAGSDSLLTMQSFMALRHNYFSGERQTSMYQNFNHKLHGLEVHHTMVMQQLMLMRQKKYHPGGGVPGVRVMLRPIITHRPVMAVYPCFNRIVCL